MATPQTILNGGTNHPASTDWLDTLEWIKTNTAETAIIASWWDYGYWITTLSERTTLIDNATISTWQIEKMAKIFFSTPDEGWKMLKDWDVDYVLIYVSGEKYQTFDQSQILYVIGAGGDEAKIPWFMTIAGIPLEKYMNPDMRSVKSSFYDETILGKMIPFTTIGYANFETNEQFENWNPGTVPVSIQNIAYYTDNSGPLELVYASPSFLSEQEGIMDAVLVYKINENYSPQIHPIQK